MNNTEIVLQKNIVIAKLMQGFCATGMAVAISFSEIEPENPSE